MAEIDLDVIIATARAAKEEAESGAWAVGERWMRHTVQSKPGQITSSDGSPRALVEANSNFKYAAILAHIAAACPDVVIALVDRVRATEADRDEIRAQSAEWIRHADRVHFALLDDHRDATAALEFAQITLEEVAAERDLRTAQRDDSLQMARLWLRERDELADRYAEACAMLRHPGRVRVCGWCWIAAGSTPEAFAALPQMETGQHVEHVLACEHNPLVQRLRAAAVELEAQRQYAAGVEAGHALRRSRLLDRLEGRLRAIGALKDLLRTERSYSETEDQMRAELAVKLAEAQVEIDGLQAEARTLRRHRDLAEHWNTTFIGLTDVQLKAMEELRIEIYRLRQRLSNYESQGED